MSTNELRDVEIRLIPGTANYYADSEGNIYDSEMDRLAFYTTPTGYMDVGVMLTKGYLDVERVHRLIALTFHGPSSKERPVVNHRDRCPANNRSDNLEWVSHHENIIHAAVCRRNNHKPCIPGYRDGEEQPSRFFLNLYDAQAKLGIDYLTVWDSIKDDIEVIDPHGVKWKFGFIKYAGKIPGSLHRNRIDEASVGKTGIDKVSVKTRDIFTGEITVYESILEAAKALNTVISAIHQAIPKRDVIRVLQKKYQVAYLEDDFQVLSEEDIQRALSMGKKSVAAYNYATNELHIFESATAFYKHACLRKTVATTALVKYDMRKMGSWSAIYNEGENVGKLMQYVQSVQAKA